MTGRTSTDYTYSFLERFGGLTEKQTKSAFSKMYSALDTGKDIKLNDMDKVLSEFEALSKDIGLTENDIDWAKAKEIIAEYVSEANNAEAEVKSQGIKAGIEAAASGLMVVAGAVLMATGVGAVAGGGLMLLGALTSGIVASDIEAGEAVEQKYKANKTTAEDAYMQVLTAMVTKVQEKRRQAQIDQRF